MTLAYWLKQQLIIKFFFLIMCLLFSMDRFVHLHYILTVTLPQRLFKIIKELIDASGLFRSPMRCNFQCFHCDFTFFQVRRFAACSWASFMR